MLKEISSSEGVLANLHAADFETEDTEVHNLLFQRTFVFQFFKRDI